MCGLLCVNVTGSIFSSGQRPEMPDGTDLPAEGLSYPG